MNQYHLLLKAALHYKITGILYNFIVIIFIGLVKTN